MMRALPLVLAAFIISACNATVKGPEAEVKLPGMDTDLSGVKIQLNNGSHFCPPGQAKKGRC